MLSFFLALFMQGTDYPPGTVLRLTATIAPGWTWSGWSGDASGPENPLLYTVPASGPVTITATATQPTPEPPPPPPASGDVTVTILTEGDVAVAVEVVSTPPPPPPPPAASLSVVSHGSFGQSGAVTYTGALPQAPVAGSTLVVLVHSTPSDTAVLSVADEFGAYAKATETISDDATMWSVGRSAIFYRASVEAEPRTITVSVSPSSVGSPHVRFSVVEIRGDVGLGATAGNFAIGVPNPGSVTTTRPAAILSMTEISSGLPTAGPGNTLLYSSANSWYAATQYRIEAQPGAYETEFVAPPGRWVGAAAAFEISP